MTPVDARKQEKCKINTNKAIQVDKQYDKWDNTKNTNERLKTIWYCKSWSRPDRDPNKWAFAYKRAIVEGLKTQIVFFNFFHFCDISIREGVQKPSFFLENCGWVGVKSPKMFSHIYMAYLTIISILFFHEIFWVLNCMYYIQTCLFRYVCIFLW